MGDLEHRWLGNHGWQANSGPRITAEAPNGLSRGVWPLSREFPPGSRRRPHAAAQTPNYISGNGDIRR